MKTKICNDCREEKPLSEFGKDANTKDGIRRICKECARVRTQDYRASGMVRKRLDAPVIDGTKQCPWCLESRTLAEFSDFYKGRVCNTCRELDFQRKFGHNIDPSTGMKQCSKCSRWLPFSAFSRSKRAATGLRSRCKECARLEAAETKQREKQAVSHKRCGKCGTVKSASAFNKHPYSRDGLGSQCKDCTNAQQRSYNHAPANIDSKFCPRCEQTKPINEFAKSKRYFDGYHYICRGCQRDVHLQLKAEVMQIPATKACSDCGQEKPASEFYKSRGRADSLAGQCKQCMLDYR